MTDEKWIDLARAARHDSSGCPDGETLRLWLEGQPSQTVAEHLPGCPRCGLAFDEMRAFFAPVDEQQSSAPVRQVRARLDAALAAVAPGRLPVAPVSISRWRAARTRLRPWVAAAAVVVLAVGLASLLPGLRDTSAPALPSRERGAGPLRGAAVATSLEPQGRVSSAPGLFRWTPSTENEIEGRAGGWAFRLESVDGTLLWSTDTRETEVQLPAAVLSRLTPGNSYIWRVLPTGDGERGAAARFLVEPAR